ncbi:MAG: NIPSNAP family protein [Balneolaceae bacterium]
MKNYLSLCSVLCTLFLSVLTFTGCTESAESESVNVQSGENLVYELRTYTTHEGRLDALHQRFENHTMDLFAKHGMTNIDYWVPVNQDNTLIYVLSHESREAAEESWAAFSADPDWRQVYEESHADGEIVSHVESVFMERVPYSPANR